MKLLLLMKNELIYSGHKHVTIYNNNASINTKHCASINSSFHLIVICQQIIKQTNFNWLLW